MKPYEHVVQYYECDKMGITHHSNYIRFMEEARVDWMDQMGYGFDKMEAEGLTSPVVHTDCHYKSPTTFKEVISIEMSIASLSALKISFAYTMRVGNRIVCTATSTHCFLEKGRPVVMEQRFPQLFQRMMALPK